MAYEEELDKIAKNVVQDAKDEIEIMAYEVLEKYARDYLDVLLAQKKEESVNGGE